MKKNIYVVGKERITAFVLENAFTKHLKLVLTKRALPAYCGTECILHSLLHEDSNNCVVQFICPFGFLQQVISIDIEARV